MQVISEVLLQRTRASTVTQFFPRFICRFPSWQELANATNRELELYLRPIGLWKRRASSLKKLALEMARLRGQFPTLRCDIEALPNVGQYVANAIQLFCHGKATALLDVNMARLLERFFGSRVLADIRHDPYLQRLSAAVVTCDTPKELNWAILDFASLVCQQRPNCLQCPLSAKCQYYRSRYKKSVLD